MYYPSYYETLDGGVLYRKFYDLSLVEIFGVTRRTFFKIDFMKDLTETIFTCESSFSAFCDKYNALYIAGSGDQELNIQRVLPAWLVYESLLRIPISFQVARDKFRVNITEDVMRQIYPKLKAYIDDKWKNHECDMCASRVVVLDGNAKLFR